MAAKKKSAKKVAKKPAKKPAKRAAVKASKVVKSKVKATKKTSAKKSAKTTKAVKPVTDSTGVVTLKSVDDPGTVTQGDPVSVKPSLDKETGVITMVPQN